MSIESKTVLYNDMSGFAEMRRIARDDPEAGLRKVAEQFEAIFMQMMLKSMRDASMGNSLFDSDQSQMYQEMFDNQLSVSLSKDNSNGLADILVKQLGGTLSGKVSSEGNTIELINSVTTNTQQRFINTVQPYAQQAAKELGTIPEILIAQAALETGWGQAIQRHKNGESGFNLFNIKASTNWQGPIVSKTTLEYKDGVAIKEFSKFRAYTSIDESFKDYVNFLKSNPRYQNALKVTENPGDYITELANAGYATDPDYANKIMNIMSREITPRLKPTEGNSISNKEIN